MPAHTTFALHNHVATSPHIWDPMSTVYEDTRTAVLNYVHVVIHTSGAYAKFLNVSISIIAVVSLKS